MGLMWRCLISTISALCFDTVFAKRRNCQPSRTNSSGTRKSTARGSQWMNSMSSWTNGSGSWVCRPTCSDYFRRKHGDLFTIEYWADVQRRVAAGEFHYVVPIPAGTMPANQPEDSRTGLREPRRRRYVRPLSQAADQQFALVDHLGRQVVVQVHEEFLVPDGFRAPCRAIDELELRRTSLSRIRGSSSRYPRTAGSSRRASLRPAARPCTRSTIHFSTRMFSPKPGHRNLPSASLRNQFTWKIRGVSAMECCIRSQWRK